MNDSSLHDALVDVLITKYPKKSKLADFIAETLCLEKETSYRRLRGDVHFTLRETGILASKLNISLDDLVRKINPAFSSGEKMVMGLPVDYLIETYDKTQLLNIISHLELLSTEANSEHAAALSGIPFSLFLQYSLLARFFRLKYINHADNSLRSIPFEKIVETEAKIEYRNELYLLYREISYTYYIWDRKIIPALVNDIKYANSIRLIKDSEVQQLKHELFRFLNDLEHLAAKGKFDETGNKFELYISDAHIDTTYAYTYSDKRYTSMLSSFILFVTSSEDYVSFERISGWVKSLRRFSTLVSGIGERERILFFDEQREIVNTL